MFYILMHCRYWFSKNVTILFTIPHCLPILSISESVLSDTSHHVRMINCNAVDKGEYLVTTGGWIETIFLETISVQGLILVLSFFCLKRGIVPVYSKGGNCSQIPYLCKKYKSTSFKQGKTAFYTHVGSNLWKNTLSSM